MSDPKLRMQDDAAEGQHLENLDTVYFPSILIQPQICLLT